MCATPIGNLDDVTLRVLRELREADLVLCEDTRRTRILLGRHGVRARLMSYHAHNEARRTVEVLPRLEAGERVALVSDAGLPGVNDPGARLVRAAISAGVEVTVLPGPSAVETALVASGLEAGRYLFLGYVPRAARARAALWAELAEWPHAAVAFESPRRLPETLRSLAEVLPQRPLAVCRELTKRWEAVARGTARGSRSATRSRPRARSPSCSAACRPPPRAAIGRGGACGAELVAVGVSRREAVAIVARLAGLPRNRLYSASL